MMKAKRPGRFAAAGLLTRVGRALLSGRGSPRRSAGRQIVQLSGHADRTGREAFVAQVSRRGGRAEVAVLLADGSDATARLDVGELDWLDVRTGDIVLVRASECAAFSA
jgi:hypothetical protein